MPLPANTCRSLQDACNSNDESVSGLNGEASRPKVFVSFTGGKDSTLALHLLKEQACDIKGLITFSPRDRPFLAHPMPLIIKQAESLGIPHRICYIDLQPGETYMDAYRGWFRRFVQEDDVCILVTGDIEDVCNAFMGRAAEGTGLKILAPLWEEPRETLVQWIKRFELKAVITCVSLTQVPERIGRLLCGRVFDDEAIRIIQEWNQSDEVRNSASGGQFKAVDICGEGGEFHTMCVSGRMFSGEVEVIGESASSEDGRFLFFRHK